MAKLIEFERKWSEEEMEEMMARRSGGPHHISGPLESWMEIVGYPKKVKNNEL